MCLYMHEQLLLCLSKRGLIYRRKVVPRVIGHSQTAQRGASPLEVSYTAMGTDSLTGLLKLHIHTHPFLYLMSLVESNLYGLPDGNIPTWMESDLMCLKKKKKKWCVKYAFMMHESSVRSSGSRLFRVSVLVEDKQLMMVLCCSDLD